MQQQQYVCHYYIICIQFGASLASLVESSNRTSAHCNVLDALHAAERTTAVSALVDSSGDSGGSGGGGGSDGAGDASAAKPAARSAPPTPVASNTTSASSNGGAAAAPAAPAVREQPDPRSWESLAEFLFGPDWLSLHLPGDELEPKLVREYEEQLKAEGKYVPPQRSASATASASATGGGASGGGAGGGVGKSTTGSTDTVSSILAEAAKLAAKSASRAATPTPADKAAAAAAAAAADGEAPTAASTSASAGDAGKAGDAAAGAAPGGGGAAGEKTAQAVAPAPRKGKQLPATALIPANAPGGGVAPATPGAATNAVNVNTPGSIGKTAGPGGKALTPSGGGGGAAGAAAASGGKAADATPGKEGESPTAAGVLATSQGVNTAAGSGGKAVPQDEKGSAAKSSHGQDDEEDKVVPTARVGWDAPFPEEIPPYPLLATHSHRVNGRDSSKGPANPHKLPFGVPLGLHLAHLVGAEEACRIDYGPNGPRKHLHKVGKSMATLKAERDEERKRRKAERAAANTPADKHTTELLDAAHKLAQEHAAARAKAKAEDQLKEVPEAYFSAASLGSSYWGSVSAAAASAPVPAAGDAAKKATEDKMDIDTADTKVAVAAATEGEDKDAAGRKRARFEDEAEEGSAAKRARTEFGAVPATPQTAAPGNAGQVSKSPTSAAAAAASQRRRPGYVPQFLPSFPPPRTYLGGADGSGNAEQAVAELLRSGGVAGGSGAPSTGASASASTARRGAALTPDSDEVDRSHRVRKSLVSLGSTRSAVSSAPWGAPATATGGVTAPGVLDNVSVPAGRRPGPSSGGPSAGGSGKKSPTIAGAAAGIQPLSRASNARVSKVLEGSLDAN